LRLIWEFFIVIAINVLLSTIYNSYRILTTNDWFWFLNLRYQINRFIMLMHTIPHFLAINYFAIQVDFGLEIIRLLQYVKLLFLLHLFYFLFWFIMLHHHIFFRLNVWLPLVMFAPISKHFRLKETFQTLLFKFLFFLIFYLLLIIILKLLLLIF